MSRILPLLRLSGRARVIALVALVALLGVAGSLLLVARASSLRADLVEPRGSGHVRVTDPVTVAFSREVDTAKVQVGIVPATSVDVQRLKDRLVITPVNGRWDPAQHYTLVLSDVSDSNHIASLKSFRTTFQTQPKVGITSVRLGTQTLKEGDTVAPNEKLTLVFDEAMKTDSVTPTVNGTPLTAPLEWSKDGASADFALTDMLPYTPLKLGLMATGQSADGDPVTSLESISVKTQALMPANTTTGIGPGFRLQTPVAVVVENAGGSRPQSGVQNADVVYEYISEYSISRMTAIYFNNVPNQVGSVRSCRMINAYLAYQYGAPIMCSGLSAGTAQYFWGLMNGPGVPRVVNGEETTATHFFRVGFKAAPHNLYTNAGNVTRVRSEMAGKAPAVTYAVDAPHPDQLLGAPAGNPAIGLQAISYAYDPGSKRYLRYDHGAPASDQQTGGQIGVKNVVVMHVGYADAGWVEDETGGAHSILYGMNGSGPAEIWSDGQEIQATWHAGDPAQKYFENTSPPYFTDASGKPIELNSGLTWIHVVGNGQNS